MVGPQIKLKSGKRLRANIQILNRSQQNITGMFPTLTENK